MLPEELLHAANLNALWHRGEKGGVRFERTTEHFLATPFANTSLSGCKFVGCSFYGINFEDTIFIGSEFLGCSFQACEFPTTWFKQAKLTATRFRQCRFRDTRFNYARLNGVHFDHCIVNANFERASMYNSVLTFSDLYEAATEATQGILRVGPIGSRGDILWAVYHEGEPDEHLYLKTGCFWGTYADFTRELKANHEPDGRHYREYQAALKLILLWRDDEAEEAQRETD